MVLLTPALPLPPQLAYIVFLVLYTYTVLVRMLDAINGFISSVFLVSGEDGSDPMLVRRFK